MEFNGLIGQTKTQNHKEPLSEVKLNEVNEIAFRAIK